MDLYPACSDDIQTTAQYFVKQFNHTSNTKKKKKKKEKKIKETFNFKINKPFGINQIKNDFTYPESCNKLYK